MAWVSRDNLFGIRTICRALSHRFVYDSVDEKIKSSFGFQAGDSTPVIIEWTQSIDNGKTTLPRLETATEDISRKRQSIHSPIDTLSRRNINAKDIEFLDQTNGTRVV